MIINKTTTESINATKKVYLAGPLFCKSEKDFNLKIATVLNEKGYSVFLPQRDGYEAASLIGKTEQQKSELIFGKDIYEIDKAEVVVMILDGRVPDDGACVELGYAYAKGKKCYGIKSDTRSLEKDMDLNPLIVGCFTRIFKGQNADKDFIEFLNSNSL